MGGETEGSMQSRGGADEVSFSWLCLGHFQSVEGNVEEKGRSKIGSEDKWGGGGGYRPEVIWDLRLDMGPLLYGSFGWLCHVHLPCAEGGEG